MTNWCKSPVMQQDYVVCNSQIFSPKIWLLPKYQLKHLHTYIYKKKACSSYDVIRILFYILNNTIYVWTRVMML